MKVFLVTSSDREHGGKVIHGVFSTWEEAQIIASQIDANYYRITFVEELTLDKPINMS